jgi:hypothetical protein
MIGWRRFWTRYACQFKNLKKLTANVPNDIYEDWGKGALTELLADERWQMLEVEENGGDYGFLGNYFPFSNASRYSFARKRPMTKFVQRVFFRLDDQPLNLCVPNPELTEHEREEREITDDQIKDWEMPTHRFWVKKDEEESPEKVEKRKRSEMERSANSKARGLETALIYKRPRLIPPVYDARADPLGLFSRF